MNCWGFKHRVADWVGGRLSAWHAGRMHGHVSKCASCARKAQTEEVLRQTWRTTAAPPPLPDCWPRVATRLAAQAPGHIRRPLSVARPAWAWGGAAFVVALTVCGLTPRLSGLVSPPDAAPRSISGPGRPAPVQPPATAPWQTLANASQEDPAVDDPGGTNMEAVWDQISPRTTTDTAFTQTNATGAGR